MDRCAVCTFGPVKGPACRPHVRSQGETVFQTVSALSADSGVREKQQRVPGTFSGRARWVRKPFVPWR